MTNYHYSNYIRKSAQNSFLLGSCLNCMPFANHAITLTPLACLLCLGCGGQREGVMRFDRIKGSK